MSECQHEKVYSNIVFDTCPPAHPWICRNCGEMGSDDVGIAPGNNEYNELCKKFEEKDGT